MTQAGKVLCWFYLYLLLPLGLWANCDSTGVNASYRARDAPALLELTDQLVGCPDSQALAWHLAGVLYGRRNALDSAIYCMEQARTLREGFAAGNYFLDLGKSNFNLGLYHKRQGQYRLAKPYLERACEVYSQLDYPQRLFTSYLQLSQVYTEIGDFQRADDLCGLAIKLASDQQSEELLAKAYLDYGFFWATRAQPTQALHYLKAANALFQQQDLSTDAVNCLQMLASTYADQGDFATAESYYQQVLDIYEEIDACPEWAIACNNLASTLITQGKYQAAEPLIQRAAGIAARCQATQVLAQSADLRGECALLKGQALAAARAFQQAQQLLLPTYQPRQPTDLPAADKLRYLPNQLDFFIYLKDQIRALEIAYDQTGETGLISAIREAYYRADQLVDYIRENHLGQSTRLFWRERVLPFYEQAVAFCVRTQQPEAAFHFFEKSKSILLLESMLTNDALSEVPPALQQREANLQAKLIALLSESEEGYAERFQVQTDLERLRDSLRTHFPPYAAVQVQSAIPVAADFRTTQLASPEAYFVHYLFGEQQLYALVGQQAGWKVYALGSPGQLNQVLSEVLGYFSAVDRIDRDPQGYMRAAYHAYLSLLEPLDLPPGGRLTIVPDGPLAYLPFAALVKDSSGTTVDAWSYLLHDYEISYAYSASILEQLRARPQVPVQSIVAFAPFGDGQSTLDYPRLDYSRSELAHICADWHCEQWLDEAATLGRWQAAGREAGILHLSTHAFSSPDAQAPHIAFFDSLLYLPQLYQAQLGAELVVLSACQTNIGPLAPGEGTLGLGRGFVRAGAGSLIATLWNVNAAATGEVLTAFYAALLQGDTKAGALRAAQQAYLRDSNRLPYEKSPYYWAGLTYYGDDRGLALAPKGASYGWWMFGGLLFLGAAWGGFRIFTQQQA